MDEPHRTPTIHGVGKEIRRIPEGTRDSQRIQTVSILSKFQDRSGPARQVQVLQLTERMGIKTRKYP